MKKLRFVDREDGIVWFFAAVLTLALVLAFFINSTETLPFLAPIILITGLLSLMLQKFTIVVDDEVLEIFFGPGLFKSRYALKEILPLRIVEIDPIFSTGIRMFQGGWLYGIKGNMAVELQLSNGINLYLRSTRAEEVLQALREAGRS